MDEYLNKEVSDFDVVDKLCEAIDKVDNITDAYIMHLEWKEESIVEQIDRLTEQLDAIRSTIRIVEQQKKFS
jgi:hypothetical protein